MLTQFFFANIHFSLTVLTALVFFATGWLYFDSWRLERKKKTPLVRSIGFFLLAGVAMAHATSLELAGLLFSIQVGKILGLVLILASLIREPLLHPPEKEKMAMFIPFILISSALVPLSAVLFLLTALIYFRKATEGYEKQLKPASYVFLFLALAEFINVSFFWADTPVVFWAKMLANYGPVWIISHLAELVGIIILGVWVWGYLRFRAQAQLFIISVASSLVIFMMTTFSFTFLLLKNLEADALGHLKTDVRVLHYALERLQSEALADARAVAENSALQEAFLEKKSQELYQLTSDFMLAQDTSFLNIASSSGKVVMRAQDKERIGDSLLEDPVVKSALEGNSLSTVVSKEGVIAPEIQVRAAVPIINREATESAEIIGTVVTGFAVDSAFVDGVKTVTGLDAAVFGGNTRAATTFVAPDGKSRFVGTKETNEEVLSKVLEKGEIFIGPTQILNQPFYTAYSPLKTLEDEIIGMLFVGKLQITLLETAQKSIELTFLGSVILMILSVPPAYFVSRYIQEHLEA